MKLGLLLSFLIFFSGIKPAHADCEPKKEWQICQRNSDCQLIPPHPCHESHGINKSFLKEYKKWHNNRHADELCMRRPDAPENSNKVKCLKNRCTSFYSEKP